MAKSGQQHTKADEGGQRPADDKKKSSSEGSAASGQGTGQAQPGGGADKGRDAKPRSSKRS